MSSPSPSGITRMPTARPTSPGADIMALVVRLLGDAEAALVADRPSARTCLVRARTLLQQQYPPPAVDDRPHGGLAGWQVRRLSAYVDEHLDATIRAGDLARVTRLSLSHFSHAFKQEFGETPLAYVMRRRLERACELMLTGNEPLAQIALACGFCDQSHLTRAFHRAKGMSPQAWRRRHAEGPSEVGVLSKLSH